MGKQEQKTRAALKKKYKKWSDDHGNHVKAVAEAEFKAEIKKREGLTVDKSVVVDFQDMMATQLAYRMQHDKLGDNASFTLDVGRGVFYGHVLPLLEATWFWHVHHGDWSSPTFKTRYLGAVHSISALAAILGDEFVAPRQQPTLAGYNGDISKGTTFGYVLILANKKFTFSYNNYRQRMTFRFSYLVYRWSDDGDLYPENTDVSVLGPDFPLVGHKVEVFWESLGTWHSAKVKRWSKKQKKWVLKYTGWKDAVYEDVSTERWKPFVGTF